MSTHPHQAGVTRILKSSPACQKNAISTLQTGSSKIEQLTLFKVAIKSINVVNLNIAVVKKVLDFVWTSYGGAHMLIGLLPENSNPKYSHIVKLGNN